MFYKKWFHFLLQICEYLVSTMPWLNSLLFKPFADPYDNITHKDIVIHLGGTKLKYKIPNILDDKHIS